MQDNEVYKKPNTMLTLLLIFVSVVIMSLLVLKSRSGEIFKKSEELQPVIAMINGGENPQQTEGAVTLYYGITCPHCAELERWVSENHIYEYIDIVKKEVYKNPTNAKELTQVATKCNIETSSIGVPFLYAEGVCYIGTPDIINYLSNRLNISIEKFQ